MSDWVVELATIITSLYVMRIIQFWLIVTGHLFPVNLYVNLQWNLQWTSLGGGSRLTRFSFRIREVMSIANNDHPTVAQAKSHIDVQACNRLLHTHARVHRDKRQSPIHLKC